MNEDKTQFEERRTPRGEAQPKRLYKMEQGAIISGVCAGLGVFFNVDPTVIRVLFVILTILSHGVGILVYFIMMIVVPYAKTPEDFASAHGDRVNPYGEERRHENYNVVNSRAYWKKISKEQLVYWKDFVYKIFTPLRELFQEKSNK